MAKKTAHKSKKSNSIITPKNTPAKKDEPSYLPLLLVLLAASVLLLWTITTIKATSSEKPMLNNLPTTVFETQKVSPTTKVTVKAPVKK